MLVFHCTQCYHRRCEPYEKTGSPALSAMSKGTPQEGRFPAGFPYRLDAAYMRSYASIVNRACKPVPPCIVSRHFPSFPFLVLDISMMNSMG